MSTVIISILLIATIVGAWLVGATLIRNIKRTSTSSGGASTPPSSSSSSSTPTTSSPAPASSGNWWGKARKINWSVILLGVAGAYLLARMTVLGGVLPVEEILILAVITGIAVLLNQNNLFFALLIAGILLINFFHPNVNQDVKGVREAQLNPPAPVEQVAPPVEEPPPSTERVVVSGKKITLTGDGTYSVPKGRKSLCFTNLGMKDGSSNTSQYLTINGVKYISLGTDCHDLPENLEGNVVIDFFPGKDYGTPAGARELYAYWKSQPGGQSEWPVIRLGE